MVCIDFSLYTHKQIHLNHCLYRQKKRGEVDLVIDRTDSTDYSQVNHGDGFWIDMAMCTSHIIGG